MRSEDVKILESVFKKGQDDANKTGKEVAAQILCSLNACKNDGGSANDQVWGVALYTAGILNLPKQLEKAIELVEKKEAQQSNPCCENHGGAK